MAERLGYDPYHAERPQPQPQPESEPNPFALLSREQPGEGERFHEELVAIIRKDMAAYVAEKKIYRFDPVAWMREQLIYGLTRIRLAENPEMPQGGRYEMPHAQLLMAWDLISQPYYKSAIDRGLAEVGVKDDARHLGPTITLDQNESKLLSAMAEAVGIPHPFGHMPQEKQESK